jgi:hypothetical protein
MKQSKETKVTPKTKSLRVLRSIGFLLTGMSAIFIVSFLIQAYQTRLELPSIMMEYSEFVLKLMDELPWLSQTAVYMTLLLVGVSLLAWSVSKSNFWALLVTLTWLAATDVIVFLERNVLAPIAHVDSPFLSMLDPLTTSVMEWMSSLSEWLAPLTALLAAIVLWRGLKQTKAIYIATSLIRYFALVLFISIFIDFLRESFYDTLQTLNVLSITDTIQLYSYLIAYSLLGIGSAIGLTGIIRK